MYQVIDQNQFDNSISITKKFIMVVIRPASTIYRMQCVGICIIILYL